MANGKRRRSARLIELEARKDLVPAEDNSGRSKKAKTGLQDPTPSAVDCQVTTEVGTSNNEHRCTNAADMPSTTALPERGKLDLLLNILKRKDRRNFFAEPVNPEEVEEYYDVIEEPMDFGTISEKLDRGMYRSLEEFEHDVFLVPDNAMLFNGPSTMYYRKASSVKNIAEKMFDVLRKDPQSFESGISPRNLLSGERPKGMPSHGYRGGRTSEYSEVSQPEICRPPTTENESIVSTIYRSTEQLLQHQGLAAGLFLDVGPSTNTITRSFGGNLDNTNQGPGSFPLMNALAADHNSNFFATRGTHNNLRDKPVQTMSDQALGNSYITNPFSRRSSYVLGSMLSGRLIPTMPDQLTQSFSYANLFAGDGIPNFSAGWKTPNDANSTNSFSTAAADPVITEGSGLDLQREEKKIHGMSPSSYRWRPHVSGSTLGPANSTVGGCPQWLRPTQLRPLELDLNKPLEQESGHTSSPRTSSRVLELSDVDQWLRPHPSREGTNTDNFQNKSADGTKTFPWTLGL